jgi:hypothetical protein
MNLHPKLLPPTVRSKYEYGFFGLQLGVLVKSIIPL